MFEQIIGMHKYWRGELKGILNTKILNDIQNNKNKLDSYSHTALRYIHIA